MSQSKPLRPIVLGSGLLSLLAVAACGHIDPPAGTGSSGGATSNPQGGSGPVAGAPPVAGMTSCGDSALPPDPITRPGYTEPRNPEVATVLQSMTSQDKIKQLYGIDVTPPYNYRDIERSYDVPSGTGKTIQGYNYRDAGRGVNLVAGQPNNRPSSTGAADYSTCFPTQSLRAASWDVKLEYDIGKAMGDETMASKNSMLLAPCMNIIRHPFWGRTQETYSEDSYHTGKMASAFTSGLQNHVVGCAKHYAANNIENARQNQNAKMNEQTLREIYSRHFEMVIQEGGIGCLMASYNAVNGVKATQNPHLLTDILRKPQAEGGFGFRGIVLSDWWAMPGDQGPAEADRQPDAVTALKAGLDIELPWSLHYGKLGAALAQNQITTEDLDRAAGRILEQKFRFGVAYVEDGRWGKGTAATRLEGVSIVGNEPHLDLAEDTVEVLDLRERGDRECRVDRARRARLAGLSRGRFGHRVSVPL